MGRRIRIVAALGAVVAVVLLALVLFYEPIEEGRCKLNRRKADPESQLMGLALQPVTPLNDKPDRAQDVPSGFEQPRYYEIKNGDRPVLHTGKLRLAGRTYQVAVVDGDQDGLYGSILSLPLNGPWWYPASDIFAIDLNQNGEFELSLYERSEVMPLGKLLKVANEYYAINIASDGRNLELSRTEPQFGTLVIESNGADVELKLWSDTADQHLMPGCQWQLPSGEYKAIHATLTKADVSGGLCVLSSNSSSAFTRLGPLEHFTIKPGKMTSIKIGPLFVVKADVQRTGPGAVSIAPVLVGCSGEEYQVGRQQDRRRPSPPAFKVIDEKGKILVADNFQYG